MFSDGDYSPKQKVQHFIGSRGHDEKSTGPAEDNEKYVGVFDIGLPSFLEESKIFNNSIYQINTSNSSRLNNIEIKTS